MGFCRRCGDIVSGTRCKCGGTAVAPVVPWKESNDPWAKTYVSRDKSPTRPTSVHTNDTPVAINATGGTSTSPTKRFPRPLSSYSTSSSPQRIGKRVSAHIASTTSNSSRPPSPLKYSTGPAPESDILPSLTPHTSSLAKVYGSVLQPKESLTTHSCAICSAPFPPDSTIYPEPYAEASHPTRFLCRNCFTSNGGSKGPCPGCSRPVLALKTEGPFVEAAGTFWHKACFNCAGCSKNIGDCPMVDLLGKPSCADCFDTCLKRDRTPKKRRDSTVSLNSSTNSPNRNIGGLNSRNARSREGSPAIEELEQRLGIVKSRESSPLLEELSHRLSTIRTPSKASRQSAATGSPTASSPSQRRSLVSMDDSPLAGLTRRHSRPDLISSPSSANNSTSDLRLTARARKSSLASQKTESSSPVMEPTEAQIEEMKRRFMKPSTSQSLSTADISPSISPRRKLRTSRSSGSLSQLPTEPILPSSSVYPPTPDLMSDFSDTTTQSSSSGPDSPPRRSNDGGDVAIAAKHYGRGFGAHYARSDLLDDSDDVILEETSSQMGTPTHTPKRNEPVSTKVTPNSTPSKVSIPLRSPKQKSDSVETLSLKSQISTSTTCDKCRRPLFSLREGGQYVSIPDDTSNALKIYHIQCFTCSICGLKFNEGAKGQAAFVKSEKGPCHVECAPPAKISIRMVPNSRAQTPPQARTRVSPTPSPTRITSSPSSSTTTHVSSRYTRPPLAAPPINTSTPAPRFGGSNVCPGCKKSVTQVSFGISEGERSVQGPSGTRWHVKCLICGGQKEQSNLCYKGRDEKTRQPGCGKKLDSAAKLGGEGAVFCRECWLLLPVREASSQGPPTLTPLPSHTGSTSKVAPQFTGTTTLARQFTGLGGGDASAPLLRQLTGGGLSPTRSLSPTKQLGSSRPRPKSVIGMRSTKSVDEGRGMFLVRQMTGASNAG